MIKNITFVQNTITFICMEQRYIILGIDMEATHSKFGEVYIVHAKPLVQSYGGRYTYSTFEDENTDYFLFKRDRQIYNQLNNIGRSGDVWSPDAKDFQIERSSNRQGQVRILYIHKSLFPNSGESVRQGKIPSNKLPELLKQYKSTPQSQSFRDYVTGKVVDDGYAKDKGRFLAWLFDDDTLLGQSLTSLPQKYFYEVQLFIISCQGF